MNAAEARSGEKEFSCVSSALKFCSLEEEAMLAVRKLALYIDRSNQQWIVQDPEGNFWALPGDDDAWGHRQPFHPNEETELEPIPSHYKYSLGLPD
jgi:hypothetical protein